MIYNESPKRDALGSIVIRSRVGKSPTRKNFEDRLFLGVEVGLEGWERAHSQGAITGHESPHAIRYAPREVNQHYQRLGIESFIRDLLKVKPPDVELWLITATSTHPLSLRLKEIQYRVDAVRNGKSRTLFEASIEVEDKKINPKIIIHALPRSLWSDPNILRANKYQT